MILRPGDRFRWWLPDDAGVDRAKRPMFKCKVPVAALTIEHRRLRDESAGLAGAELMKSLTAMIRIGVDGWENFPEELGTFDADKLQEHFTEDEIVHLAFGWPDACSMNEEELKNLQSPSPTGTGISAANAETASVTNHHPQTSQPPSPCAGAPTASACPSCQPPAEAARETVGHA